MASMIMGNSIRLPRLPNTKVDTTKYNRTTNDFDFHNANMVSLIMGDSTQHNWTQDHPTRPKYKGQLV